MRFILPATLLLLSACVLDEQPLTKARSTPSRCEPGAIHLHRTDGLDEGWRDAIRAAAEDWSREGVEVQAYDEAPPQGACVTRWVADTTSEKQDPFAYKEGWEVRVNISRDRADDVAGRRALALHEMGHTMGLGDERDPKWSGKAVMYVIITLGVSIGEHDREMLRRTWRRQP